MIIIEDALMGPLKQEYAEDTEQRANNVAMKGAPMESKKEEYAKDTEQRAKKCSFDGCPNEVRKGGVCSRHGDNN